MKQCQKKDLYIDEKSLWIPQEAYKFAHKFRLEYNGELTETLIEQLLFELNKIWNQREKRIIGSIKAKYSNEAGCNISVKNRLSPKKKDRQYSNTGDGDA